MMKFSDVTAEIRELLSDLGRKKKIDLSVLTSRVMNNHPDFNGEDSDFHLCASYRAIRHEIREQLNRRKRSEPKQFGFEFEFLQSSYAIEREGKEEHIPLDEATDLELLTKADEYDQMSASLREHANEIRRYVSLRAQKVMPFTLPLGSKPFELS